jgi:putative NADPH-quinone reductase
MRFLVVVAHPDPESLNMAAAKQAVSTLQSHGHHVDLLDLYAIGFRATMSADEHADYQRTDLLVDPAAHQRDPMVAEHIRLIQAADGLVLVYPTWWSTMPALLKGWLERTMVPGVGFVFDRRGRVRPGLRNLRHLIGISTYGSPWLYIKAINDNGRRTVQRTLRVSTSMRARFKWFALYRTDTCTEAQRHAFLQRIDHSLGRLR